jgi:hypothetical protein
MIGWGTLNQMIEQSIPMVLGRAIGKLREGLGGKATDENTQAVKDLAFIIREQGRKLYGGGERFQAAIPAGLKGFRLQEALHHDSIGLGGVAR